MIQRKCVPVRRVCFTRFGFVTFAVLTILLARPAVVPMDRCRLLPNLPIQLNDDPCIAPRALALAPQTLFLSPLPIVCHHLLTLLIITDLSTTSFPIRVKLRYSLRQLHVQTRLYHPPHPVSLSTFLSIHPFHLILQLVFIRINPAAILAPFSRPTVVLVPVSPPRCSNPNMPPSEGMLPNSPSLANYSAPISIVSVRSPSTPSSTTASSLPTPAPPSPPLLPPRSRDDEGVVLGCLTGEVRRMRSVLDMRLGAMAGAPVLPETEAKIETSSYEDDTAADDDRKKHTVELDVFGIPICAKEEPVCAGQDAFSFSSASDSGCSVVLAESPSRLDLSALMC